jgi:hypothetical protein
MREQVDTHCSVIDVDLALRASVAHTDGILKSRTKKRHFILCVATIIDHSCVDIVQEADILSEAASNEFVVGYYG